MAEGKLSPKVYTYVQSEVALELKRNVTVECHVKQLMYEAQYVNTGSVAKLLRAGSKTYHFAKVGEGTKMTRDEVSQFILSRTHPAMWKLVPYEGHKQFEEEKEGFMDLELKKFRTVGVRHPGDMRIYNFLVAPGLDDLKVDDFVLCQRGEAEMSVGVIVEIHAVPSRSANRFVFQKVDTAANERLIALRVEGESVVRKLKERVNELQRKKIIDDIVANDPEGKALLERAKELGVF